MSDIQQRKKDHISVSLKEESQFQIKTNGLENYDFLHYASSELTEEDISLETEFLNKKISFPFLIPSMTGGFERATELNSALAEIAEELNIPIAVGSQRAMLEDDSLRSTFEIIKEKAKSVPVLANIGAAEFAGFENFAPLEKIINSINADAVFVHLNLLQEMIQPDGMPNFKGLLKQIEKFVTTFDLPLFVKEVGFGIAYDSARDLLNAGAKGIDVAGAGGTSWSKIEQIRSGEKENVFSEWGLPTSFCIRTVAELKNNFDFVLIASGGINNSLDYAKALALGADLASSARTLIKKIIETNKKEAVEFVQKLNNDLKKIMILTNSKNLKELRNKIILKKELF